MLSKTLLILGGYGNAGYPLSKLLLQFSDCCLVLAGRDPEHAKVAAERLNREFEGNRASGMRLDAQDAARLKQAFEGVDMVIVAASTTRYIQTVANAAVEAGIDYLDIQLSTEEKLTVLESLREKIEEKDLCFITDGGFHPGLPAAMIRYAALKLDTLYKANIGSLLNVDWANRQFSEATIGEFTEEIIAEIAQPRPAIYRERRWRQASMFNSRDYPRFDFGLPYGKRYCAPTFLEELRLIPEMFPSLQETGFYVSGFNWFVDRVVFPLLMIAAKIHPHGKFKLLSSLFFWGLRTFSKPPYITILQLEVSGEKQDVPTNINFRISHNDAYWLTAAPVAACLLQYLDGTNRQPGLWLMGHYVEPARLFNDMEAMGINIEFYDYMKKPEPN